VADLVAEGETLFGTTSNGGTNGLGTIFSINTNGTGFQVLKQATITEGAGMFRKLVIKDGLIYGAAVSGGAFTNGGIFRMSTNGSGFVNLKSFEITTTNAAGVLTNSEGASPQTSPTLSDDGMVYGLATAGGLAGWGTIFRMKSDGSDFTVLKHFSALSFPSPRTNSDGAAPLAGMILQSNMLYGTTRLGGFGGLGTVFKINTNGGDYTVLKHFTLIDGATPYSSLAIGGHTLFGTTRSGGSATNGTVFKISTDGTGFAVLWEFSGSIGYTNNEGAKPEAGLCLDGSTLYGATRYGGIAANGVVFKIELSPPLNFHRIGDGLVLFWTNSSFNLQTSSDLFGPFTNIPNAISPYTNSTSGQLQLFRLLSD
jgi:uncharacterized repeat protein (TIGR03803 family)